jgi:hypothetical protein
MLILSEKDREAFRERFKDATVDAMSFTRKYAWCDLGECHGTCCSGGVWTEPEELKIMQANDAYYREKLPTVGVKVFPDVPLLDTSESMDRFTGGTNKRPFDYSDKPNYPKDWDHTTCTFRRDDGACGLQLLAVAEGKPAWHYKPFYCYLFPIDIVENEGKLVIEITDSADDAFSAATMCGRTRENGKPGYEIFAREIAALSEILNRDIMAEIKAGIAANDRLLSAV